VAAHSLPTSTSRTTVLRSPHVDRVAEQFEIRTHSGCSIFLMPTQQDGRCLMKLDLPAGVDVEIKAFGKSKQHGIGYRDRRFAALDKDNDPGILGKKLA